MEDHPNIHDIAVTLPQTVSWADYELELATVADRSHVMRFKVPNFPKVCAGSRCYIVHKGLVKGWMDVVGLKHDDFTCSTTGQQWRGKFVERSGEFHPVEPHPMPGFQGFRYVDRNIYTDL